jgi:hypothetical protein
LPLCLLLSVKRVFQHYRPNAPVDEPGLSGRFRGGGVVHRREAMDRTRTVDSTGQRNTFAEHFSGRMEA